MKQSGTFRFYFLGAVFAIIGLAIIGRIVLIGTDSRFREVGKETGELSTYKYKVVEPERGNIYDRWGNLLAGNKEVYEVGVELQYVNDNNRELLINTLTELTGVDRNDVAAAVNIPFNADGPDKKIFATIKKDVPADVIDQIIQLNKQYKAMKPAKKDQVIPNLDAINWTGRLERSYPEGTLAANVLGFYSDTGWYGVEEKYNDLLSRPSQSYNISMDPYQNLVVPEIPAGASLILTIDREIQSMTETVLDQAIVDTGSASGTILIMDPNSGELLAMATTPRGNPNEYYNYGEIYPGNTPFNRAIQQTYEPGSVFKVLTMASAIDAGVVTPDTEFLDTGSIEIGGWYINNWDGGAWGYQTMTGCMQHSLNVCLTWVAQQLTPTSFYQYLQAFGIGRRTNIDLAGEQYLPLSMPGDPNWYEVNLGTNSFGQGLAVTPIQMITASAALANDGRMMAPHILKAYIQDGRQIPIDPIVVGTPIKPESAHTITEMLAISLEGESSSALVDGYRMAGKTGTAEIPTEGGYSSHQTNASFVGWGPVDDPQFIVYIWLEKPQTDIWGSIVAAPIFSQVVKELVVLMDLPPDQVRLEMTKN